MLAPMEPELQPLVRHLGLVCDDGDLYRARVDRIEVLALVTTMGMQPGARAAERMLEAGVDRVIVVGVAGGIDPAVVKIGDVVVPATVVDRRTGGAYGPPVSPHIEPGGTISCGDDLITDPDRLAELGAAGAVAVDMETAAVAAVCEAAGTPWSAFRGISDYAGDGLVDQELFEATNPDGTADPDAMARYLEAHPEKLEVLTRLGQDLHVATDAAATAAIRSFVDTR
jgi:nucleoside phosphorylase